MATAKDILGNDLTADEQALLKSYADLKALHARDLSPALRASVAEAIASLWQAVNDLCLSDDRPVL